MPFLLARAAVCRLHTSFSVISAKCFSYFADGFSEAERIDDFYIDAVFSISPSADFSSKVPFIKAMLALTHTHLSPKQDMAFAACSFHVLSFKKNCSDFPKCPSLF